MLIGLLLTLFLLTIAEAQRGKSQQLVWQKETAGDDRKDITKFEFYVNLKTAKQIGLIIPQSVLYRADGVIR